MENRGDLKSILPYLPLMDQTSSLIWPRPVAEELDAMSRGPSNTKVNSGEALASRISSMRRSLSLDPSLLKPFALEGYAVFFDRKISREESGKWFGEVFPALARLLLRLPSMLEMHYQKADHVLDGITTGLRILDPQEAGIVFLSQELIAALLACSFFCLFPESERASRHLRGINFHELFSYMHTRQSKNHENKIRCIIHYFERICCCMPMGFVSFERKVLPFSHHPLLVSYPTSDSWNKSITSLCPIEVHTSGSIEDQTGEALEVDFADEYFGGLTLRNGCVQEEIRFMINPELIAGMMFLPRMDDNEAIEIVGVERFSHYTGYGASFQFSGDYVDKKELDIFRRRKTRVIAIDAMPRTGTRQYKPEGLLREVNKALCGFLHQCTYHVSVSQGIPLQTDTNPADPVQSETLSTGPVHLQPVVMSKDPDSSCQKQRLCCYYNEEKIGVATGNWGCGIFKGDPELKTMIQWLAASQSGRPFLSYYTFELEALQNLDQVTKWIGSQEWTVGDLWSKLVEYSSEKLSERTRAGLFSWLIPSLSA
ncbi:PREDICTED: probable poly(ADP-ribose) glycohydrolase 2 [Tarenaya hassleriana]|uniref:probable poly(ADP-ribose) glycohydrolase 2 n=1 Tax=Tarenaya hassleriana TaxID=28532 RepID=UPI00053CA7DA|nr:PREDICTED: probable poly(ADP-ribose) glycohydrolase 2 [Tarenaya hassleriana]